MTESEEISNAAVNTMSNLASHNPSRQKMLSTPGVAEVLVEIVHTAEPNSRLLRGALVSLTNLSCHKANREKLMRMELADLLVTFTLFATPDSKHLEAALASEDAAYHADYHDTGGGAFDDLDSASVREQNARLAELGRAAASAAAATAALGGRTRTSGCVLDGRVRLNRVPGAMYVTPHSEGHNVNRAAINMTHTIKHLSFGKDVVERLALGQERPELVGLRGEFGVAERLHLRLQRVDSIDDLAERFDVAVIGRAKDGFHDGVEHVGAFEPSA